MAYLKGGTVVDGNLYIEGSLKVKNKTVGEAELYPYVKNGNNKLNHLTKFNSEDGELIYTFLKETTKEDSEEGLVLYYNILGCTGDLSDDFNKVHLDIPVEKILLKKYTVYAKNKNGEVIDNFDPENVDPENFPDFWDFNNEPNIDLVKINNSYTIPEDFIEVGKVANVSGNNL